MSFKQVLKNICAELSGKHMRFLTLQGNGPGELCGDEAASVWECELLHING